MRKIHKQYNHSGWNEGEKAFQTLFYKTLDEYLMKVILTSILKSKDYTKNWGSHRSVYGTGRPAAWQNLHPFSPSFIHLREKQHEKYTKYEERVSKSSEQWELSVCFQKSNIKCYCSPQVNICYGLLMTQNSKGQYFCFTWIWMNG